MMKKIITILLCLPMIGFGQTVDDRNFSKDRKLGWLARHDVAKFAAIRYLITTLGVEEDGKVTPFRVEALSTDYSAEITTLFFNCENKDKAGLVIGFFNAELNTFGETFKESSNFLILNLEETDKLLNAIDRIGDNWDKRDAYGNNSIYFKVDELVIFMDRDDVSMRIFWGDYDSSWSFSSFNRTKKRYNEYLRKKKKGKL